MKTRAFDRAEAIRILVESDLNHDDGGAADWLRDVLHDGFKGYRNWSDDDLRDELAGRELGGQWIIESESEVDDDGNPLEWSNADGWVTAGGGDRFDDYKAFNLPIGGTWIRIL
jgi:hypothetical protein